MKNERIDLDLLLFEECLNKNKYLFLYPFGPSMKPFINSKEKVCIQRVEGKEIKRGDIVVFYPQRSKSQLRIHRVIKVYKGKRGYFFLIKGDTCFLEDGFIQKERIIGKVTSIIKGKDVLRLNTRWMKVVNLLIAIYSYSIWYGYRYFVRKIFNRIKYPQINNLLFKIFWTSMIDIPKFLIWIFLRAHFSLKMRHKSLAEAQRTE